jgi:integrase
VDLENGWVEFEAGKTGNKTYCVVWDEEIRDFFIQAKKRIGPLFVGRNGRAIKSYRNAFESACKRAGIEGFRWHDLRRCAASWMLENGFQLTDLKKLGLWKSAQTIEKHYHQVQIKQIQRRFQVATVATNLLAVNG